jgi:hypothetical protein
MDFFFLNSQISHFVAFCVVGADLFCAGRQTVGHDKTGDRVLEFHEHA